MRSIERFRIWLADAASVRWLDAAHTLRERFREEAELEHTSQAG